MKKVKTVNYKNDGFSINFYSNDVNLSQNAFLFNVEEGIEKNVVENIILAENARVNFNYIRSSGPIHSHDFFEIDLVIDGEIYESNGISTVLLKKNDAVVLSPLNYHSFTKNDSRNYTIILNISLNEEFLKDVLGNFYLLNFPVYFSLSDSEVELILSVLINAYNYALESDGDVVKELKRNAVSYIVSLILTRLNNNNNNVESKNDLLSAIIYINSKFHKNITCSSVAEKFGYTPNYFSSIFKKNMGMTFSEYVLNLRLERARYLLITKDMSIMELCLSCGFHTAAYFSSLFKKKYKLTPGEYRNKYSNIK